MARAIVSFIILSAFVLRCGWLKKELPAVFGSRLWLRGATPGVRRVFQSVSARASRPTSGWLSADRRGAKSIRAGAALLPPASPRPARELDRRGHRRGPALGGRPP